MENQELDDVQIVEDTKKKDKKKNQSKKDQEMKEPEKDESQIVEKSKRGASRNRGDQKVKEVRFEDVPQPE